MCKHTKDKHWQLSFGRVRDGHTLLALEQEKIKDRVVFRLGSGTTMKDQAPRFIMREDEWRVWPSSVGSPLHVKAAKLSAISEIVLRPTDKPVALLEYVAAKCL